MYAVIEFNEAAFRYGVTRKDIHWAITHYLYDGVMEYENKYLAIGFDAKGTLLEIMYNIIDENSINVFHAMPCREKFYSKIT
jgi:D-alanine-D-alanine ligase-like ATP-grasp enzyme